jgi:hypothetical protein
VRIWAGLVSLIVHQWLAVELEVVVEEEEEEEGKTFLTC